MNKSFDTSQSGHYLPPITRNDSTSIPKASTTSLIQTGRSPITIWAWWGNLIQLPSLANSFPLNSSRMWKNTRIWTKNNCWESTKVCWKHWRSTKSSSTSIWQRSRNREKGRTCRKPKQARRRPPRKKWWTVRPTTTRRSSPTTSGK